MSIEEFTWFVMTGCEGGETLILPAGQRHSCEQRAGGVISGAQQILWVTAKPCLGGAKGKIQVFLRKYQTQSVCLGLLAQLCLCRVPEREEGTDTAKPGTGGASPGSIAHFPAPSASPRVSVPHLQNGGV